MPEIGTEIGVRLVYSLFVHKRDRASIFGGRSMVTSARIVCMLPFKRGEAFFFFFFRLVGFLVSFLGMRSLFNATAFPRIIELGRSDG